MQPLSEAYTVLFYESVLDNYCKQVWFVLHENKVEDIWYLYFYFFFLFWKIIYCYIKFQLKCLVQIFKIHFFSSSGKMYELQFFKRVLPKSTYIILYNIDWFWFIMRDSKSVVCKISAGHSCVCIVMFNHCRSVVCGHISLIWIFYEHEYCKLNLLRPL